MLAFRVDRGDIEGVDVSGLTFALVVDSPPVMADGGWKLGVVMDGAATEDQAAALGRVLGGELGGPPAMLGPLVGEMAGIEQVAAEWREHGDTLAVRFGDLIDTEVELQRAGDLPEPVRLVNVFHPANTTLTLAPATKSKVEAFGIRFDGNGTSGFTAPYAWSA
jgi:hypothetical protein